MPNATLQRQYQRQLRNKSKDYSACCFLQQQQRLHPYYYTPYPLVQKYVLVIVSCLLLMVGSGMGVMMFFQHQPTNSTASNNNSMSPGIALQQQTLRAFTTLHSTQPPTTTNDNTMPVWLQDYIHFAQTADPATTPVLQWTCVGGGCGGWGDRVLGIVQTFLLAVCHERLFLVDDPKHVLPLRHRQQHSRIPEPLMVVLDDRNHSFWRNPTFHDAPFVAMKTNLWMGQQFWESACWNHAIPPKEDAVLRHVLHYLFEWPQEIISKGEEWLQQAGVTRPFVGVHVRTGRLDHSMHLFQPRVSAMIHCARQWQHQCNNNNNNATIYLASDDAQVRKEQYADDVKTLASIEVEHYKDTQTSASSSSMIEFWMLTQADCVVGTPKSKFSYVAGIWAGCRRTDDECTLDCKG